MEDWTAPNVELRAHRDQIHETARLKAEARAAAEAQKVGQQLAAQIQYEAAQERLKAVSPPGLWT